MKKTTIILMALACGSSAFAGGLLTNTNQNAAFNRNFAQEGKIDITSIYANPAGGAFLSKGWHLSLNNQMAFQRRIIDTTYPRFSQNANNRELTHSFVGKATAPAIPSFTVSFNREKWSLSAHFALSGGGGKCEFDEGLGSFERVAAEIPSAVTNGIANKLMMMGYPEQIAKGTAAGIGPNSYTMNSSMKGRSYCFGLQIGGTYKFLDNLSGYVGVRGIYATNNYTGFVGDLNLINSTTGATALPAEMEGTPYVDLVRQSYGGADPTITLNCDQTGFGVAPILGIDWKINDHWNVSAKYEFRTILKLKNSSQMSDMTKLLANSEQGKALAQFIDGEKVREDIPAMLALGVQYSPIEQVRVSASYHQFFDKDSKKFADKQKLINHNTHEFLLGAEYDACKLITVSASYALTRYGVSDAFMNDISFNLSNYMFGGGVRINATKRFNIDLGYMCTFYNSRNVTTMTAAGPKNDHYDRKNHTFGVGLNFFL